MKKLVIIFLFCILLTSSVSAYHIFYYHNDHLGNPAAITNENGEVVWKADYEPFGEVFNEEEIEIGNKFGYNTKELDKNTNLLYYGARFYDSDIGRFTTADTVKGSLSAPQSLNRYSYVLNNPLKYVDLLGNEEYQGSPAPGQSWEEYQGQMGGNNEKPIAVLIANSFSRYPNVNEKGMQQYISNNKDKFEFRTFSVHGSEEMEGVINSMNDLIAQGRTVLRVNFFDMEPKHQTITKNYVVRQFGLSSVEWLSLPQITKQKGRITILGADYGGCGYTYRKLIVYVAGSEYGVGVKGRYLGIPTRPDTTKSDEYNLQGILEDRYPVYRSIVGIIPQEELGIFEPINPKDFSYYLEHE
ncbi:MAG: RHS domain-containing protein [Nanoarchaeota archaeon]|nr:RHS domain-containing protein [Nanoarchaeota archaeon]